MIRVLIEASSSAARTALEGLLRSNPTFQIIGASWSAGRQGRSIAELDPDVVLAEVESEDDDLVPELLDWAAGGGAVVMLVEDATAPWTRDALHAGVRGILPSGLSGREITAAVQAAAAGLVVLHLGDLENLLAARAQGAGESPDALVEPLTPREVEVLRLLAEGLGNKEIASRLGISEHTVKFHVASIMGKLGATSRTEAVTLGIRQGLILI